MNGLYPYSADRHFKMMNYWLLQNQCYCCWQQMWCWCVLVVDSRMVWGERRANNCLCRAFCHLINSDSKCCRWSLAGKKTFVIAWVEGTAMAHWIGQFWAWFSQKNMSSGGTPGQICFSISDKRPYLLGDLSEALNMRVHGVKRWHFHSYSS